MSITKAVEPGVCVNRVLTARSFQSGKFAEEKKKTYAGNLEGTAYIFSSHCPFSYDHGRMCMHFPTSWILHTLTDRHAFEMI